MRSLIGLSLNLTAMARHRHHSSGASQIRWLLSILSQSKAASENSKNLVSSSPDCVINQRQKKKGKEKNILNVNIKSIFQFTHIYRDLNIIIIVAFPNETVIFLNFFFYSYRQT